MAPPDTSATTRPAYHGTLVALLVAGLVAIAGLMIAGLVEPTNLNSRWSILIGGLAAIVLFLGILQTLAATRSVAATTATPAATTRTTRTAEAAASARPSPFGDVHPVVDVEGIDEVYEAKLKGIGIHDTKQLWEADAASIADACGVHENQVRSWQVMAELMAVHDVGKQYAELLLRAGVRSIDDLAAANAQTLTKKAQEVEASREVRVQGNPVTLKLVRGWISEAKAHAGGKPKTRAKPRA